MQYFAKLITLLSVMAMTALFASTAQAAGSGCGTYKTPDPDDPEVMITHHYECSHAPIDFTNKASLQRGAQTFLNYCVGCHSAKYVRYSRIAKDLDIPKELVAEYLMVTTDQIGDHINTQVDPDLQAKWFGNAPPDLSLETRLRSPDWVYTYLLTFYPDNNRQWGVNNIVIENVAMPHVLSSMEKQLGQEEYQERIGDLVNFMTWMGDPVRHDRKVYGAFVILFLLILLIPVYLLNKEYWKNIH